MQRPRCLFTGSRRIRENRSSRYRRYTSKAIVSSTRFPGERRKRENAGLLKTVDKSSRDNKSLSWNELRLGENRALNTETRRDVSG